MSKKGQLILITGSMFSGKTTTLLRMLFNDAVIGLRVLYINHSLDSRTDQPFSTHNPLYKEKLNEMSSVDLISVKSISECDQNTLKSYDVIGIDESQFFTELYNQVQYIVESLNKKVIVSGLISDYKRKKFGQILDLFPLCDEIIHLKAYCGMCASKNPKVVRQALFSHKKNSDDKNKVIIGGSEKYIPLCRECYLNEN